MGEKKRAPSKTESGRTQSCSGCRKEAEKRSGSADKKSKSGRSGKKESRGDPEARKKSDTQCGIRDPERREALERAAGEMKRKRSDFTKDPVVCPGPLCPQTVSGAKMARRQAAREELTARREAAVAASVLAGRRHRTEPVDKDRPLRYLALGDSITTGTNNSQLKGVSYSDYIAARLNARYGEKNVRYRKSITPGYTVRDLYRVMESYLPEIRVADFITISIGGNDLLGAGSASGYAALDMKKAKAGIADIKVYLPKLVNRLRQVAGEDGKDARILIMNLYNPYCIREMGLLLPSDGRQESLHGAVEGLLRELDETIRSVSGPDVLVVDTASAFDVPGRFGGTGGGPVAAPHLAKRATCEDRYTHFYDYPYTKSITTLFTRATRDPHPTDAGHRALADAHWLVIEPLLP